MSYFLFISLILFSFIFRQSKALSVILLLFMWVMFGWSYGNADYLAYYDAYYGVNNGGLSVGLQFVFSLFSRAGLSYRFFLISFSFLLLLFLFFSIRRLTNNTAFTLGLYLFFPFCLDVVQIKNFTVVVLLTLGISSLFSMEKKGRKGTINKRILPIAFFCLCIITATLMHYSAVFYLSLLVPYLLSKRKTTYITLLLFILLVVTKNLPFFELFASRFLPNDWVSSRLLQGTNVDIVTLIVRFIRVFMVAGIAVFNSSILHRSINNRKLGDDSSYRQMFISFVEKANIFLIICFPLMLYSQEMYRIQQNFMIINFIVTSYVLESKYKISLADRLFSFESTIFASVFLFYYVILRYNTMTVFVPFFENNLLFGSML